MRNRMTMAMRNERSVVVEPPFVPRRAHIFATRHDGGTNRLSSGSADGACVPSHKGSGNFSQGYNQLKLEHHRQADRRQGPVVLRDGRFPVRLHTDDMKAAFVVDRFPPKRQRKTQRLRGLFPQLGDVRRRRGT